MNNKKEKITKRPVERHDNAAWANIEKQMPVSQVAIPNELDVIYAKEYVEENQK